MTAYEIIVILFLAFMAFNLFLITANLGRLMTWFERFIAGLREGRTNERKPERRD